MSLVDKPKVCILTFVFRMQILLYSGVFPVEPMFISKPFQQSCSNWSWITHFQLPCSILFSSVLYVGWQTLNLFNTMKWSRWQDLLQFCHLVFSSCSALFHALPGNISVHVETSCLIWTMSVIRKGNGNTSLARFNTLDLLYLANYTEPLIYAKGTSWCSDK
jgi:hypothetical protein